MVSYVAPSSPRHVSFMPIPIYSRPCRDDELYVIKNFEKHAGHCSYCADASSTFLRRSTLCAKGHERARDVAQYIYSKEGRPYSLVDRKADQRVRLEIPANMKAVRSLLGAWEMGLELWEPREKITSKPRPTRIDTSRRPGPEIHYTSSPEYDYSYTYPEAYTKSPASYYYPAEPTYRRPKVYRVVQGSPRSPRVDVYYNR